MTILVLIGLLVIGLPALVLISFLVWRTTRPSGPPPIEVGMPAAPGEAPAPPDSPIS